ncbi:MAG: lipopolysaccharide transport periplasmic protein LptA [Halothiobacillus sp. 14-56-357]|uniref:lipopolysaccharide transport periplasmic protein LptA n=1 Tax=Halothiobacillus sp. 15-55-196 TaxID=1970382 RepID=UPI000BCD2DDC|nr:lipopolysaccharide transport periplasmic protein LptA [Halothiobacillus sp. 15-55-196]OZB37748.1 MAG: lipopolysaccharide transport periplasmic protein LptA [Halothiobacillus sp. 15-55-196]OZB57632.1 MAG: lipopolysaccharide transport periplasmic protein LptA [Halothiobacillus sp. 14-56-357]OZB78983.1 MAG: lipopolysaccharide transport periplasmic protein LptA [Halothiobacillus sp. 13-55-115]
MHRSNADSTCSTGWTSALLILGIMAGLMTPTVFAAKADRNQPIDVTANEKVTDYKQGTSIYTGNVVINQGSLHATGDKATLYVEKGELVRAVLEGKPATFQELDDKGQLVKGSANDANYLAQQQKIILTGNAKLDRQGDTLSSQQITYDMNAEVVKAGGKAGGDRVHVVIQPRNKNADQPKDGTPAATPPSAKP